MRSVDVTDNRWSQDPCREDADFMFPSNPMMKKTFLLSKMSWAKSSESSPFPAQASLTDGNEKKSFMSVDPINHKLSCAAGFPHLDRQ